MISEREYLEKQAKKRENQRRERFKQTKAYKKQREALERALAKEQAEVDRLIREEELGIAPRPKSKQNQKCGIYRLYHKESGRSYIGQSVNITSRKSQHYHQLKKGVHGIKRLQADYDKYGKNAFEFEILVECAKEDLDKYEMHFHQTYILEGKGLYSDIYKMYQIPAALIPIVDNLLANYQTHTPNR